MKARPPKSWRLAGLLLAAACSSRPAAAPDASADGGPDRDATPEARPTDGPPAAPETDGPGPDPDAAAERGPVPWAPPCSSLCPTFVDAIDLEAVSLVPDRTRKRLYATISGARGDAPGLAIIDPLNRRVIGALAVGGLPRALAIADDDSSLWIGVDEAHALRRLDLTTDPPQLGPLLPLPSEGPPRMLETFVGSMLVVPGQPRSVAASLRYDGSTGSPGVRLFDDGVLRPMQPTPGCEANFLVPGPTGYLFGYGGYPGELCVFRVSDLGLEATRVEGLLERSSFDMSYAEGRLYNRAGEVLDASNPAQPVRLPRFPVQGSLLPQPGRRVLMLSVGSDLPVNSPVAAVLRVLDGETSTEVQSIDIAGYVNGVRNLIQLDEDKLVMIDGFGSRPWWRILFLQHKVIRPTR